MPKRAAPERMSLSGDTLQFMQSMWDLVHALDVRSKWMAREIGVTGPQRLVIRVVGQNPNLTAREISGVLGIHPSTLTGIFSRLEKQGMLVRKVDRVDHRKVRFRLTAAGTRIDRERRGTVEAAVRRALARSEQHTIDETVRMLQVLTEELASS